MIKTFQTLVILTAAVVGLRSAGSRTGEHPKTLLDDWRVHAVAVDIPANASYAVQAKTPKGAVWIAVDSLQLTGSGGATRTVARLATQGRS